MIGRVVFAVGLAIATAGTPDVSQASGDNSLGALAAAKHCGGCHAMPEEADTGRATPLDEISTTRRVWTDTDLRTALPRMHGAKAAIVLTSEEAVEIGQYLQSIQSGHPVFFPQ